MVVSRTNGRPSGKRVMLVDERAIFRRGLRTLIEDVPGWEVCAEASRGTEAAGLTVDVWPNIAVVGLSTAPLRGIKATIQLRKALPEIEVLVYAMHQSEWLAGQALRAGARGYLIKGDGEDRVLEALEALSRHRPYFSPDVSDALLQSYLHSAPVDRLTRLTRRERQVVKLIAEGKSNKVIAWLLDLSLLTVETHRCAAMRKIGAKSVVDLTRYAVRNDLVNIQVG